MATTAAWLQSEDYAHLAFTLVFEGYNLAYTTADVTSEMATAWSGTDWTTFKNGLDMVGETRQEIEPFNPRVAPDSLTFRLVDYDGTLRQLLLAPNNSSSDSTLLEQNMDANDTTAYVRDVSGFDSSGTLYAGHEGMAYSGKTVDAGDDSFTGLTRGKWVLWGTSADNTRFGRPHKLPDNANANRAIAPEVRTIPKAWWNRSVGLYLHHREAGIWSTKANSKFLWAGRIASYGDGGHGVIELRCTGILDVFASTMLAGQFRAQLAEGAYISTSSTGLRVHAENSGVTEYNLTTTIDGGDTQLKWDEAISNIQEKINAWTTGGNIHANHRWSITVVPTQEGPRTEVRAEAVSGTFSEGARLQFSISPTVATLLGIENFTGIEGLSATPRVFLRLTRESTTVYRFQGNKAPYYFCDPITQAGEAGRKFKVENVVGTWAPVPDLNGDGDPDLPASLQGAEAIVQVGSLLVAATYDEGDQEFTIKHFISPATDKTPVGVRIDEQGSPPEVKQVWLERGKAGSMLLRFMLSTGVEDYNSSTYDKLPDGVGIGLPYGLIDVNSFETLDDDYELALENPKPFREILQGVMAVNNRYVIFEDGQIRLIQAGFDTPNVEDIIELTESNKAVPDDRPTIEYSADGVINSLTLKYGQSENVPLAVGANGERVRATTINVIDVASVSDFGQRKAAEINAPGLLDPDSWVNYTAAPALAYFSREVAIVERTFNANVVHMVPGDIVKITDNYLVDPRTGTRGVSGLAGIVIAVGFNWETGVGRCRIAFLPGHQASRYSTLAPSALVTAYNTGTYVATLSAHGFSRSTDALDSTRWAAGDKIRVVEMDDTSPTVYTGTIASVGTNEVTFTGDITSGAGLSGSSVWVMEYDDISTVQTAQRTAVFIADDGDLSTGYAADDHYLWAGSNNQWYTYWNTSTTYSTQFVRPDDSASAEGEPLSVHKLWYLALSINNLLGYKTNQVLINDPDNERSTNNTSDWQVTHGPIKVPLFGLSKDNPDVRNLKARVRIRLTAGSDVGSCRIVSTDKMPRGTSLTGASYPGRASTVTFTTTSTTYAWKDEQEFLPVVAFDKGDIPYTILTVEFKASNTGSPIALMGVHISEDNL